MKIPGNITSSATHLFISRRKPGKMLVAVQLQTAIPFGIALLFIGSRSFRRIGKDGQSIRSNLLVTLAVVVVLGAVKMSYDASTALPVNFYSIMEVSRHESALDIRRSYKTLSRRYHPDKNPSLEAEVTFGRIKAAYDVLIDEEARDIYNRFGSENISFDPRKDELRLITEVMTGFVAWGVFVYLVTAPQQFRGCRSWAAIALIFVTIVELVFALSELQIPEWMPAIWTEFDLVFYLHSALPIFVGALCCLTQHYYVDVDQASIAIISDILAHQQMTRDVLSDAVRMLSDTNSMSDGQTLEAYRSRIVDIQDSMNTASASFSKRLDDLRKSSVSLGADYYWLVLVVVYAAIFYFQS